MTKLYFHNATSSVSGTLPTTKQGAYTTALVSVDAYTVNRSMSTTIGTSQTTQQSPTMSSTNKTVYFTKFVSDTLTSTSIAADTWNYAFAAQESAATGNFPVTTTGAVNVTVYVWRPGTGTKIGTIMDGNSSGTGFTEPSSTNTEKSVFGTFTGSAVTCQAGDVIIMEVYFATAATSAGFVSFFYFDGTTETNNNGTTVSSHASYIESPGQTLTFGAPSVTLNRTVYVEFEEQ